MKIMLLISNENLAGHILARLLYTRSQNVLEVISHNIEAETTYKLKRFLSVTKTFSLDFFILIVSGKFRIALMLIIAFLYKVKSKEVVKLNGNHTKRLIDTFQPDVLVTCGVGKVKESLSTTSVHTINLHHGIVPYYRGVSSPNWVSLERDYGNFGYTLHSLAKQIDAGSVYSQERVLPFQAEPIKLFRRRRYWEGIFALSKILLNQKLDDTKVVDQDDAFARNLRHTDKPIGFGHDTFSDRMNFHKYTKLNGKRRSIYLIRDVFDLKPDADCDIEAGWYVLNYHHFCCTSDVAIYRTNNTPNIYTSIDNFKSHIQQMQNIGEILPVENAYQRWKSGALNNDIIFSITIDDGLSSYHLVSDFLKSVNIKPTIFVNTAPLMNIKIRLSNHRSLFQSSMNDNEYLSVSELTHLLQNGQIQIGSHTHTHPNLSNLADNCLLNEITQSHEKLSELINDKVPHFAFPFGKISHKNYSSEKITRSLKCATFDCYGGINKSFKEHFSVLRVGVHNEDHKEFIKLLKSQWCR
jgi:methionyl-tRNA formyltransferase/peptidoglycan/xylan/chitin deacetylase (PgdA/CDA1 family)